MGKYFVFARKMYNEINKVPEANQWKIYLAIVNYAFYQIEPELDKELQEVFDKIKTGIKVRVNER